MRVATTTAAQNPPAACTQLVLLFQEEVSVQITQFWLVYNFQRSQFSEEDVGELGSLMEEIFTTLVFVHFRDFELNSCILSCSFTLFEIHFVSGSVVLILS